MSDFDIKMGKKNKLSVEFEDPKQNITLKNQPTDKKLVKTLNDVIMDVDALQDGSILQYEANTGSFRLSTGNLTLTKKVDGETVYVVQGAMEPQEPNAFDLGSPVVPFRSLYLSGNTIVLGNLAISDAGNGSIDLFDAQSNAFIGSLSTITAQQADIFNLIVDGVANLQAVYVGNAENQITLGNGDIYANNIYVTSNLQVNGDIILRGDSLQLGDGGDVISLGATVNTSIVPTDSDSYDLGTSSSTWRVVYANTVTNLSDPVNDKDAVNKSYVDTEFVSINANLSILSANLSSQIAAVNASISNTIENLVFTANGLIMGVDQDIKDGAVTDIESNTTIYDALDKLNEAMLNVHNGTYVRDVTFNANPSSGGIGTEVTLTLVVTGTPNEYTIDWGDGTIDTTTDSTPSHTYTDNSGSPYTVTVTARNTDGYGAQSNAQFSRADYIIIYTADPVLDFDIYSASIGGQIIVEANTGQIVYFDNESTNSSNVDAQYTINWGDGTFLTANNSESGGVDGGRLSHVYITDTGSGRNTITLSMTDHETADPSILPLSTTSQIKIFDTGISAPNNITTKSISFATSSQGTQPRLASGFTENATGLNDGDSVNRFTTGTITSSSMSTYFHTTGTVTQQVNDVQTSNPIIDESLVDYYNLNASGTPIDASSRIYAPNLYETGTKARISYDVTSGSVGVNKIELSTVEGNSNELLYVYDDMTSSPSVDVSSASLSEVTVGYNYISGIPYYDNGDILRLSGVTVSDLTGQTYKLDSSPFTVSGSPASTTQYSYIQALPTSDLTNGIPNANISSTLINDLDFSIGSADTTGTISFTAENVNGSDVQTISSPIVQGFTGTDVIDESSISIQGSNGGKRITGFVGDTPIYSNTTDYYVSNAWSGAVTVEGTDEAIIRYGSLSHFAEDLSSGYLPVGPNLSTGRSGTQYFRFAFKKSGASSIRVRMSGKVSGFWISAPGTTIDNTSNLNGWLDASIQYAGAGVPGGDTVSGGNGSDGCAFTGSDRIQDGVSYSNQTFDLTFGTESTTNAFNNQVLISIALNSDDSITALSIEDVS